MYAASEQAEASNRENGSQGFPQARNALHQQKGKRKEENAKVRPAVPTLKYEPLPELLGLLHEVAPLLTTPRGCCHAAFVPSHIPLFHAGCPSCWRAKERQACIW